MSGRYLAGVDVGGTFTDVFLLDRATGAIAVAKTPTTPADQSEGFLRGLTAAGADFAELASIVHGTTTGTNALLERKGARAGLITTAGFRDVLEMRRRDRPRTWGLRGDFEPVIPRDLRLETAERVLADGRVLVPVDEAEVRARAEALLAAGCESVAIFFINAFANPENERRAAAAVRAIWPNPHVTAAAEILPEIREFERCSTAALNAYLQPVVSSYLDRLEQGLAAGGFGVRAAGAGAAGAGASRVRGAEAPQAEARGAAGGLLIVQSNGGVMDVAAARAQPVRTALSGPAAGVIAARSIAAAAGFENVITCDMGGTSFDVSLIAGGVPTLAPQTAIDFGLVIRLPMIEILTIGAGGGSIARVDASGLLHVGPHSAGSDPGPVCYGLGNDRPTVTDANLVLGRINPDRPIGGGLARLDVAAARAALAEQVGRPLGLGPEEAAEAVVRVANARMAGAIRLVSIERGHDPARFAAIFFGGGGALHAGALMREVGLGAAIVPRFPGVTSALGCVVADMRQDRVQTVNTALEEIDAAGLGARMATIAETLAGRIAASGVPFERLERSFELDMLYAGQTHAVTAALPGDLAGLTRAAIRDAFEAAYRAAFGRLLEAAPVRIVNLRVAVTGVRGAFDMTAFAPAHGRPAPDCVLGRRRVGIGGEAHEAPVYDRLALGIGAEVRGPALLEQPDTTVFVDPGLAARVDAIGNLVISREAEG